MPDDETVAQYLEKAALLRLIAASFYFQTSAQSLIRAAEVYEEMAAALERLRAA